jgi:ubiquinone/menaquinone biosynthesis C-methylase UbiE
MLKKILNAVMERRAVALVERIRPWLPGEGPVLDLGSGTGHLGVRLHRELKVEVVPADVSDLHVVGRPPVLISDGPLPFDDGKFSAALLLFMLAYPSDPVAVLAEATRVARGRVILVQTLSAGPLGYVLHRLRELFWTLLAFHASKALGYVPADAAFTMRTRRFYTHETLRRDVESAGLRVRTHHERPVLPGGLLVEAGWLLERDD